MIPSNPIGPSHTDEITKKVEGLSPAKRTLLDLRMKKKEAEAAVEVLALRVIADQIENGKVAQKTISFASV